MPGQAESPALVEARAAIERKVAAAEKILFGAKKCAECHQYEDAEWQGGRGARSLGSGQPGPDHANERPGRLVAQRRLHAHRPPRGELSRLPRARLS